MFSAVWIHWPDCFELGSVIIPAPNGKGPPVTPRLIAKLKTIQDYYQIM